MNVQVNFNNTTRRYEVIVNDIVVASKLDLTAALRLADNIENKK